MRELFAERKRPYICTPLTGKNENEILKELDVVLPEGPDLIEWRADFFQELHDHTAVLSALHKISAKSSLPVLFTIRSTREGGEPISLTEEQKVALIGEVCKRDAVQAIDYEIESSPAYIRQLRHISSLYHKKLILSYHNFECMPPEETLLKKLYLAEFYGADVAKAAVMPSTRDDVLSLLDITNKADKELNIPLITMAMGNLGVVSRIIGWTYGSILTFGSGVQTSAPGQVQIGKLKKMIEMIDEEMNR
ncbi:type I 3-dehydroquinate dehydratase [Siminovitchia sediminis]|uniref:3-dehydroquinate dehydratase n=1 Tax=Siminovitchia sediminis TaxID=1274353 RepID=A0ABW4KJP4_9BACI